jgi:copper chaperone CopZ
MTHTYQISGMTCSGCQNKVESLLYKVEGLTNVTIDLAKGTADITMGRHIPTDSLQAALKDYPKYQLTEAVPPKVAFIEDNSEEKNHGQQPTNRSCSFLAISRQSR